MGFLLAFCVIDELAVSVSTARYESSLLFWSWFDASRNRFDSANTALDQQDQITELFFLSPKGGGWEEGGGGCIYLDIGSMACTNCRLRWVDQKKLSQIKLIHRIP